MYANINGVKIFFDIEGSGYVPQGDKMVTKPAMFILHGGPGCDHTYYKPWLTPLSQHMQLIYVDHRGNGLSDRTDITTYTMEQMADDVEELRKYLGLEKVHIFGNSFGGMLAQVYAIRYPNSIDKLILVTTTPSSDFAQEAQAMAEKLATPEQLAVANDIFEGKIKTEEELANWWSIMLPLYFHNKDEKIMAEMGGRMITSLEVGDYMFKNEISTFDLREELKNVQTETLVIGARHDWVTPYTQSEEIHSLLPNSELIIFENSGHMPFIEEQEAFNQKLLQFIKKVPVESQV